MVSFINKKISQDSLNLAELLKKSRQQKGWTLEAVAKKVSISKNYLEALEEGKFNELPGEIYTKNFLRVYSNFLGLDFKDIASQYLSEKKIYQKTGQLNQKINQPLRKASWTQFLVTPQIIRNSLIGLIILILLVYLGIKIKTVISPPFLIVTTPIDNLITNQKTIEISGQTEKEVILSINGQQVLIDEKGYFSEPIDLQEGSNIIKISAIKKHSQETVIYRKIVFSEETINSD